MKISTDGNVLEIANTDAVVEKMIAATPGYEKIQDKDKDELKKDMLKQLKYNSGFLFQYPAKSLIVGQSWKMPYSSCNTDKCLLAEWTLKDVQDNIAFVQVISKSSNQDLP